MPVQKASVREQVRRTLTERILAGAYQPGERLVELQIARELGTSQGSVREALRELEASRLVETTPRRGTRVRVVSTREVREAYFVRGVLEEAAAATATVALAGNVGCLRDEVAALLRAAGVKDFAEQAARVYAIHHKIVAASGNATLLRLWESLALETRIRVRLGLSEVNVDQVAESYDRIFCALERGDAAAAGRLLREHAESYAPADDSAVSRPTEGA
jgi:DNA-binding GntR family transcriptional regulator